MGPQCQFTDFSAGLVGRLCRNTNHKSLEYVCRAFQHADIEVWEDGSGCAGSAGYIQGLGFGALVPEGNVLVCGFADGSEVCTPQVQREQSLSFGSLRIGPGGVDAGDEVFCCWLV